jgi:hypothetical protein
MKTKHIVLLGAFLLALGVFEASAFYDPGLQRWINRDPLGEKGFEAFRTSKRQVSPEGRNLSAFVLNAPVSRWDPTGLECNTYIVGGAYGGDGLANLVGHKLDPNQLGAVITYPNPCGGSTPFIASVSVNPNTIRTPEEHPWFSDLLLRGGNILLQVPTTTALCNPHQDIQKITITVTCCSSPTA